MKENAMTALTETLMQSDMMATAFGSAALAGQVAWPLLKKREHILTLQLGIAAAYAAHYGLQGVTSGATVCLVGATQTTIALLAGDRPWLSRMGLGFIPLVCLVGALTFSGPATILAVTACCLIMLGRLQSDTVRMRALMLAASPFGITHDIFTGAYPALAGALLSAAIAATAFHRELASRRSQTTHP